MVVALAATSCDDKADISQYNYYSYGSTHSDGEMKEFRATPELASLNYVNYKGRKVHFVHFKSKEGDLIHYAVFGYWKESMAVPLKSSDGSSIYFSRAHVDPVPEADRSAIEKLIQEETGDDKPIFFLE
jgi:hypothetical protein